jgi:hypothetical protein
MIVLTPTGAFPDNAESRAYEAHVDGEFYGVVVKRRNQWHAQTAGYRTRRDALAALRRAEDNR